MKKSIMIALIALGGFAGVACNEEYEQEGIVEPGLGGGYNEGIEPEEGVGLGEEQEFEEGETRGNIDQRNNNEGLWDENEQGVFESPNEQGVQE